MSALPFVMKLDAQPKAQPIISPSQSVAPIGLVLSKLDKVKPNGKGRWMACCPAHDDRSPSLSIEEAADGKVLLHCFVGCTTDDVLRASGLPWASLFPGNLSLDDRLGYRRKSLTSARESAALLLEIAQSPANIESLSGEDLLVAAKAKLELPKIDAELAAIADQLGETDHKLARYVEIGDTPTPSAWLLPGFIAEGVAMLAGGHGAGKTTTILPMSLAVAGVHPKDYALAPDHWRHVVYITEDTHQARRIICGYGDWLNWPGDHGIPQTIKERLHLVEARRSPSGYVAAAGSIYREQFTRTVTVSGVDGLERTVELLPLVVIDTLAATIEMENENDNSEASAAIAALKQQFAGLPIWIVGHTAKANMGRADTITARGASAWEADANQVIYLVRDDKDQSRWLVRGKTRFESPWPELEIKSNSSTKTVLNQFGQEEELTLRWSIPMPPEQSRTDRSAQIKAKHAERDRDAFRWSLLITLTDAFKAGERLNRTALRSRVGGNAQNTSSAIAEQIADGWIYEVEIPKREQLQGKSSFLVALSEAEREEFQRTGVIPDYLLEIPPSWKKPPKEPKSENGNDTERHDENEEDF